MSDLIIYKHNELIDNFIFNATEKELQILNYAVAITNPSWDNKNLVYEITVSELVEQYKTKSKSAYKEYREALLRLMKRDYLYTLDNEIHTENLVTRVTRKIDCDNWLKFKFNDYISQRISNLQGLFTKYNIKYIAMFKSRYAFMLYEFCKMNLEQISSNQNREFSKSFTVQDFKDRLDITNKYKEFFNLENKVLNVAKENINKHSDIKFTYRVKRKGRTPVTITLIAKYKPNADNFRLEKEQENIQEISKIELPKPTIEQQQKSLNYLQKIQKTLKK